MKILVTASAFAHDGPKLTDKQVAKICPNSKARNGKRSAYSKPSGAAPLYYEKDVTKEMIQSCRGRE